MATTREFRPVSGLFKALSDETRLRIVALLAHGEVCVCHLQQALELPQPTVSRHLAVLRAAGLVEARREASWMHYRLREQEDPLRASQLRALTQEFAADAAARRGLQRARRTTGPGCGANR